MLNFKNSRKITFDNKKELTDYFYNKKSPSCEMSFANLRMWSEVYKTQVVNYGDDFIFFSQHDGMIYFPIKEDLNLDELMKISQSFKENKILEQIVFYDVDRKFIEKYPKIENFFQIEDNLDHYDYLYDIEKLAQLSGTKLKKKRNLVNQFKKLYPDYFIKPVCEENYNLTFELARTLNNKLEHSEFLDEEDISMDFAFKNFKELLLNGFILYANESTPVGFTVYSKLNQDYADIHYEKANHEIKGGSQMLTTLLAEELKKAGFKYMNREQDLGNLGIRQAKLSLDPIDIYSRVKLIEK